MRINITPLTPQQLWYICMVYPESIKPSEAKKEFIGHKVDLSYWKAVYRKIYKIHYVENPIKEI